MYGYKEMRALIFVFILLASMPPFPALSSEPQDLQNKKPFSALDFDGPRMKDLYYVIIRDMDAQLLAMSTGKIDVLSDILRPVDVKRLAESGVVDISMASTFHGFFITFNVQISLGPA